METKEYFDELGRLFDIGEAAYLAYLAFWEEYEYE